LISASVSLPNCSGLRFWKYTFILVQEHDHKINILIWHVNNVIPANEIGFAENRGPFNLLQLKVIQEVITLVIFILCTLLFSRMTLLR